MVPKPHVRLVINGLGITVILNLRKDQFVITRVSSSCGDHKVSKRTLSSSEISTVMTLINSLLFSLLHYQRRIK